MDIQRIADAVEAIGWLAGQASQLGEERSSAVQMTLTLALAQSYMAEYAVNVSRGKEPYDALVLAAVGAEELTDSQRSLAKLLMKEKRA
jgi:hypothetical protein